MQATAAVEDIEDEANEWMDIKTFRTHNKLAPNFFTSSCSLLPLKSCLDFLMKSTRLKKEEEIQNKAVSKIKSYR